MNNGVSWVLYFHSIYNDENIAFTFLLFSPIGTACSSAPCYNGGTCSNNGSMFICECPVGFTGFRCEIAGNVLLIFTLIEISEFL